VTDRRALRALIALVALAAALRLWRLGHQSFWLDESFTAMLVDRDLWGMLKGVRETESTPHLYYLLAWLWSRVFGDGEAALRSMSALFGIATVPVAYAAARELFSQRAALVGAALVAVNPWLVWYSQEARAYSLFVLLATASLLFLVRRDLVRWSVASALALLTHYFAAFLIAPMAVWLLWTNRTRTAVTSVASVAAVGIALAPLALAQRASGHTKFISDLPLGERVTSLPKKFVTGELGTPTPGLGVLAGLLSVAGLVLLWRHGSRGEQRGALGLGALVAAALIVPLVLAVAGLDYLFPRNAIAVFVPAALALGAGFGAERGGRLGIAVAGGLAATAIAVNIQVSLNENLQRDDFRGLAAALGPPAGERAIVLNPQVQVEPLEHYAGPLREFPNRVVPVYEVDAILITRGGIKREPQPPTPDFVEVERRSSPSWRLVRFRVRLPRSLEHTTVPEPPPAAGVGPPSAEAARLAEPAPALRLQSRR
jgi:mannosyltransferase